MNNQLRVSVVLLGAIVVLVTYTFPLWQRYLSLLPGGAGVVLPCDLPPAATDAFLMLDETVRAELLALANEDVDLACGLIEAQLLPDNVVPIPQQELPGDLLRIGVGQNFQPAISGVSAEGALTVFELADGRQLLRVDDLRVTNLPGLGVWLSGAAAPTTEEEMQAGDNYQLVEMLQGNVGSQNYILAPDVDLNRYRSVVLYSEELGLVISYASYQIF